VCSSDLLRALEFAGLEATSPSETTCPPDEQFAAFMDNKLTVKDADPIRKHIVQCVTCHLAYRAWLETIPGEGPPVPARLLEQARALFKPPATRLVLKFLKNALELLNPLEVSLVDTPALQGARTRSREEGSGLQSEVLEFRPALVEIDVVRVQALEDTGTVKVELIPCSDLSQDRLARLRVEAFCQDQPVQSWPLFAEGTSLNPLASGSYRFDLMELHPTDTGGVQMRSIGEITLELAS
ncbi:MAG: hypothetical protein KJ645_06110, partial [Planctomycetes bacterium]|nr:hypothetical protein [Planctomycetota bacterium]